MKKLIGSIFLSLFSLFAKSQTKLDADTFEQKISEKGVQVVDVRTPAEIANGKIKGASEINFNDPNFKANAAKLDKTKPVALYCASGIRSGRAASILTQLGFTQVFDLAGGIGAWNAKGKAIMQAKKN